MKCHNIFFIHVKVMENEEFLLHIHPVYQLFLKCYHKKCIFDFFTTKKFVVMNWINFSYHELHNYYCLIYTNEKKWRSLKERL